MLVKSLVIGIPNQHKNAYRKIYSDKVTKKRFKQKKNQKKIRIQYIIYLINCA